MLRIIARMNRGLRREYCDVGGEVVVRGGERVNIQVVRALGSSRQTTYSHQQGLERTSRGSEFDYQLLLLLFG